MLGRTFIGEITGPSDFGTGLVNTPSENSGDPVGFSGSVRFVFVPDDYIFGAALSETSAYSGQSFGSLGLKPGSYVYSWGSGEHADTVHDRCRREQCPRAFDLDNDAHGSRKRWLRWLEDERRMPSANRRAATQSYNFPTNASNSASAIGTRCLSSGKGALFDVGTELLKRGDPLALQAVVFRAKVAIDLRVTGLMAARIAEHVLGEQILRVAA